MGQFENLERISRIRNEELLEAVDRAIELSDDFLRLLGVDIMYKGGQPERPNGHVGHVYENELAEVIVTGSHYFVAYVDRLVDEGYLDGRESFPLLPLGELDEIKLIAANAGITFKEPDFGFAENAMRRRLERLRKVTRWVSYESFGWCITPEGMAYLDGALEEDFLPESS